MTLKATYTPSQTDVDFFARNASGQWWNTSGTPAFETYNGANLADYRITATETPAGSGLYQASEPTGTVEFELRYRAATLADSYIVAGPATTDAGDAILTQVLKIPRAAAAVEPGGAIADGVSLEEAFRIILAVLAGKATATGTSVDFRAIDDSKVRVSATTTAAGSRSAVSITKT